MATFNHERQMTFLEVIRQTCNKSRAARAAGVALSTIRHHEKVDALFAERLAEAMDEGLDMLEDNVRKRAFEGIEEPVFHQGMPTIVYKRNELGELEMREVEYVDDQGQVHVRKEPVPEIDPETKRVKYHTVRKYSDGLAQFFLKAHRPEKYRERSEIQHGGNGMVVQVVTGVPKPARDTTPEDDGSDLV